jgi:hypothetical protein
MNHWPVMLLFLGAKDCVSEQDFFIPRISYTRGGGLAWLLWCLTTPFDLSPHFPPRQKFSLTYYVFYVQYECLKCIVLRLCYMGRGMCWTAPFSPCCVAGVPCVSLGLCGCRALKGIHS